MEQSLKRAGEFESEIADFFRLQPASMDPRSVSSRVMYSVAFEHGQGVRLLILHGKPASAFGLMRLQYEAMVRGVWLRFAAPDKQVQHVFRDLTQDSIERLPMVREMLRTLPGVAPPGITESLEDFADKSLKPLNSFVHSGAHTLQRSLGGYPDQLVKQVMVASSGLQFLAAQEVIALAKQPHAVVRLYGLEHMYAECLPQRAPGNASPPA